MRFDIRRRPRRRSSGRGAIRQLPAEEEAGNLFILGDDAIHGTRACRLSQCDIQHTEKFSFVLGDHHHIGKNADGSNAFHFFDHARIFFQEFIRDCWLDERDGGFFYTSADHEKLIARNKETHDNATPSGNGLAATALLKLARLTGRADLEEQAVETLEMMSGQLARIPMASGQALIALDFLLGPAHELTIVASDSAAGTQMLNELHSRFLPNKVVHVRSADVTDESLAESIRSTLKGKQSHDGAITLYVCANGACAAPVVGPDAIRQTIAELAGR